MEGTNTRTTVKDRVSQGVMDMITAGNVAVGDRLPAIESLAAEFKTSVRTVHLAMEDLEARGYVIKKHGSGTFVTSRYKPLTLRDTVAVCMESSAHLFGELWALLMQRLNERHLMPLGIDTSNDSGSGLMARLRHTDAGCYLVHTSNTFPYGMFKQPSFQSIPVIAFISWESDLDWPNLYRVLCDFDAGGRLAANHLWDMGHRRVLILGTSSDMYCLQQPHTTSFFPGRSFVQQWEKLGGTWEGLPSEDSTASVSRIQLQEERLATLLRGPNPPTAIFGTRDVEVWQAQQVLQKRLPAAAESLSYLGFYDTPWSQTGQPPFSTVSLDLPSMADASMAMLDALQAGHNPERRIVKIIPKLQLR